MLKFLSNNILNIIIACLIGMMPALIFKNIFEKNISVSLSSKISENQRFSGETYLSSFSHAKPDIEIWSRIFGVAPSNNQTTPNDSMPVSLQTADVSNYELLGTVTGNISSARAYILIRNTGKKNVLKIGERLDSLKLTAIKRFSAEFIGTDKKKIILKTALKNKNDSGKQIETFPDEKKSKPERINNLKSDEPKIDNQRINMTRDEVDNLLYNELEKILTTTNIVPHFKEGKMIGIRINKIADNSSLTKYFGIKLNDIIQSVNGKPVDSVEKGMKLWDNMKTESHLDICVIRNGETMNFNINIR